MSQRAVSLKISSWRKRKNIWRVGIHKLDTHRVDCNKAQPNRPSLVTDTFLQHLNVWQSHNDAYEFAATVKMRWPDIYGYSPAPPRRYTSCCGFVLTALALLGALWGVVYFPYQLFSTDYMVSVSRVDGEQDLVISPNSVPELPQVWCVCVSLFLSLKFAWQQVSGSAWKQNETFFVCLQVGVSFRLKDGSILQRSGALEVIFRQRYAVNGYMATETELRDVHVPADECSIQGRPKHRQTT